jgi:hypothetical protein
MSEACKLQDGEDQYKHLESEFIDVLSVQSPSKPVSYLHPAEVKMRRL